MWPFKNEWKQLYLDQKLTLAAAMLGSRAAHAEIADLKDSNARLADALAAAKVRAGDTWNV